VNLLHPVHGEIMPRSIGTITAAFSVLVRKRKLFIRNSGRLSQSNAQNCPGVSDGRLTVWALFSETTKPATDATAGAERNRRFLRIPPMASRCRHSSRTAIKRTILKRALNVAKSSPCRRREIPSWLRPKIIVISSNISSSPAPSNAPRYC